MRWAVAYLALTIPPLGLVWACGTITFGEDALSGGSSRDTGEEPQPDAAVPDTSLPDVNQPPKDCMDHDTPTPKCNDWPFGSTSSMYQTVFWDNAFAAGCAAQICHGEQHEPYIPMNATDLAAGYSEGIDALWAVACQAGAPPEGQYWAHHKDFAGDRQNLPPIAELKDDHVRFLERVLRLAKGCAIVNKDDWPDDPPDCVKPDAGIASDAAEAVDGGLGADTGGGGAGPKCYCDIPDHKLVGEQPMYCRNPGP